ncbi:MAG: transglutaminase domain-containing protein [Gammaproteobacteria bacterium]|nr:MAG: transglutaminase domain-containing protein [Gammaproteobacteria bacterium]
MKITAPKGVIGLALLLWGYQVDLLILSVAMAVITEVNLLIKYKIRLELKDLKRISDLSTIIYVILLGYSVVFVAGVGIISFLLKWLPVVFWSIILVQRYSQWSRIPLAVISLKARKDNDTSGDIDMSNIYLFAVLVGSASTLKLQKYYLLLLSVIVFITIFKNRNRRFNLVVFSAMAIVSVFAGFFAFNGIKYAQSYVEDVTQGWLADWYTNNKDPFRRTTAIGSMMDIKGSNYILLRVDSHGRELQLPLLIKEGAYDRYGNGTWYSSQKNTIRFLRNDNKERRGWSFGKERSSLTEKITITTTMDSGEGLLPIPLNTTMVGDIPHAVIELTELQTLKISVPSELVIYDLFTDRQAAPADKPRESDLVIHSIYKKPLDRFIKSAFRGRQNSIYPHRKLQLVKQYFMDNYSYTLDLRSMYSTEPSINFFLDNAKKGHCEYFATATVLLLRRLGIPARYVYGYSLQEYSALEDKYIVRDRHAHAWAIAYIDGKWINVDNTPPDWGRIEEEESTTVFTSIYNLFSWLRHKYAIWKMGLGGGYLSDLILWLVLPLSVYLFLRLRRKKILKPGKREKPAKPRELTEAEQQIYDRLNAFNIEKASYETVRQWYGRIEKQSEIVDKSDIVEMIEIYYCCRFDPDYSADAS